MFGSRHHRFNSCNPGIGCWEPKKVRSHGNTSPPNGRGHGKQIFQTKVSRSEVGSRNDRIEKRLSGGRNFIFLIVRLTI